MVFTYLRASGTVVARAASLRDFYWRCFSISNAAHQINEDIRDKEIRLIGSDGAQLGIMSPEAALEIAVEQDLDLVKISPTSNPPVCKIMDYGKYRFEQQKQQKASKKNQKTTETKEVQLTPVIGQHDLETKARKAREFIENGNKVNCCVYFRGRQLSHKEVGEDVMNRFLALLEDVSSIDKAPFWEEKRYTVILAPSKKKQEKKNAENEN